MGSNTKSNYLLLFSLSFQFLVFFFLFFFFTRIDDIQTIPPLTPSGPQGINTASSSLHGGVDHEIDGNNGAVLTGRGTSRGWRGIATSEPARIGPPQFIAAEMFSRDERRRRRHHTSAGCHLAYTPRALTITESVSGGISPL